jgi:predicted RNA-binding Zn ribbon-like protein
MFAHDTEVCLLTTAALINTSVRGTDSLTDQRALVAFLDVHKFSGRRDGTDAELVAVRDMRPMLRELWNVEDTPAVVGVVNDMLASAQARPFLTDHDGWPWHLHLTPPEAPLVDRIAAEAALGVADLIRAGELTRLGRCAAPDCDAVLVDLTRNRSRRFCDTGNCGNRQHVAAYRARRAVAG